MSEEDKTPETTQQEPSEKVDNSEESTQTQENTSATPPVEEKQAEPEKEVTPQAETTEEPDKETAAQSVLDELLEKAKGEPTTAEPKEEKAEESIAEKFPYAEKEFARVAVPEIDPSRAEFNPEMEKEVVKEYLYEWALNGGTSGPSLKEVALAVKSRSTKAQAAENKEAKKEEATNKASSIPGPEAERMISKDKEEELMKAVKFNNTDAIAELLRLRSQKTSE